MKKYKVVRDETSPIKNKVEINGVIYEAGDVLDENLFKPRPADAPAEELSELESLLGTGHIILFSEE